MPRNLTNCGRGERGSEEAGRPGGEGEEDGGTARGRPPRCPSVPPPLTSSWPGRSEPRRRRANKGKYLRRDSITMRPHQSPGTYGGVGQVVANLVALAVAHQQWAEGGRIAGKMDSTWPHQSPGANGGVGHVVALLVAVAVAQQRAAELEARPRQRGIGRGGVERQRGEAGVCEVEAVTHGLMKGRRREEKVSGQ